MSFFLDPRRFLKILFRGVLKPQISPSYTALIGLCLLIIIFAETIFSTKITSTFKLFMFHMVVRRGGEKYYIFLL